MLRVAVFEDVGAQPVQGAVEVAVEGSGGAVAVAGVGLPEAAVPGRARGDERCDAGAAVAAGDGRGEHGHPSFGVRRPLPLAGGHDAVLGIGGDVGVHRVIAYVVRGQALIGALGGAVPAHTGRGRRAGFWGAVARGVIVPSSS